MNETFDKVLATEPVRLAIIAGLLVVVAVLAVAVSLGWTDRETVLWSVGLIGPVAAAVDKTTHSKRGPSSPATVEQTRAGVEDRIEGAILKSHADSDGHIGYGD